MCAQAKPAAPRARIGPPHRIRPVKWGSSEAGQGTYANSSAVAFFATGQNMQPIGGLGYLAVTKTLACVYLFARSFILPTPNGRRPAPFGPIAASALLACFCLAASTAHFRTIGENLEV